MDDLGVPPFRKPPYMAMNTYRYHFRGNIHEHQLVWRELQGCKVLTHPRIYTYNIYIYNSQKTTNKHAA